MIYSISLSFQITVYSRGHPCLAIQVPGVAATDLQGEYYEEGYGGADGLGFTS